MIHIYRLFSGLAMLALGFLFMCIVVLGPIALLWFVYHYPLYTVPLFVVGLSYSLGKEQFG